MENECPSTIEQQLEKIQSCTKSKVEFSFFLRLLVNILSDLLNDPFTSKYRKIQKNDQLLSRRLLSTIETKELLILIGFHEIEDAYLHLNSDENRMKLENCLDYIQTQIALKQVATLSEICESDVKSVSPIKLNAFQTQDDLAGIPKEKKSKSNPNIPERKKSATCHQAKVKEFFLLQHLKKERTDSPLGVLKFEARSQNRSADYQFNENGFFHQSCGSKEKKQDRCFLKELFHMKDHHSNRKWNL